MAWFGAFALVVWCAPATASEGEVRHRGPFSGTPIEEVQEQREERRTAEEEALEERLRQVEALHAELPARVVVLQDRLTPTDYTNRTVQQNVRIRINRPSAKFYPDVDLYQAGRKDPTPGLRPLDQRAMVPDDIIPLLESAYREAAAMPWNALDDQDWGILAAKLRGLADQVWFLDREELREPMFLLYAQIGRAADNSNNAMPPYFEQVAGHNVNYYQYLAATMAVEQPDLMSKLTDPELYEQVDGYRQRIEQDTFAPMTLNFEQNGVFDPAAFTTEYVPYLNGLELKIDQIENGLYAPPPGLIDIYLERPGDGYGMSLRVESVRVDRQQLNAVRDQARKRMGIDFIEQLLRDPEQCIPDIDGDILDYLAIYQKLHARQDVYVVVPVAGSVHDILIWKWMPDSGSLRRINDNTGGFPVRFVALAGGGPSFNAITFRDPTSEDSIFATPRVEDFDPENLLVDLGNRFKPAVGSVPIGFELRGHYSRLMVGLGMELGVPTQGELREIPGTLTYAHGVDEDGRIAEGNDRILLEPNGDGESLVPLTRKYDVQRGVFVTVAGVLGPDASSGFGPRLGVRGGWTNVPRALEMSAHGGWSKPLTKQKSEADSRVKGLVDVDFFFGALVPTGDTLHLLAPYYPDPRDRDVRTWTRLSTSGEPCVGGERPGACGEGEKVRRFARPLWQGGFSLKAGLTF